MDIVLILFLTLLSGIFSMSEIALVSSRRMRLDARAAEGSKGAAAAARLLDDPTQLFSTIQMGNTTIALLNGIVGEGAFGAGLAHWLLGLGLGLGETAAHALATLVVVVVVTYITIVFGELVAKRIGQSAPESIACKVALPLQWLATGARPFVALLAMSTNAVLRLLRIPEAIPNQVTEAEISASLEHGVEAGIIEEHEHRLVRNVFGLDDRQLTSIMVPRSDIEWLDEQDSIEQAVSRTLESGHSWYPVCRGGLDDVVGIVRLSVLLGWQAQGRSGTLAGLSEPATFVPETLSGLELLEQFRAQAMRMTFVVDEYGVVQGMLTPLDLLEAITGELKPEEAVDAWATQRPDGSWDVDGAMPAAELKARLDIGELPEEDKGRYNTVAGLMQSVAGDLLSEGEWIECAGWRMEVSACEGRRIETVWIRAVPPDTPSAD